MKRPVLLVLLSILSIYTYSQRFLVTPAGLVNEEDTAKHYIVIHIDSISAQELYNRANHYIEQGLKNPGMKISEKKEGEFLHLKITAKNAIAAKGGLGIRINLNLVYRLHLDFKDGKVKYEILDLEMYNFSPYVEDAPFYIQSMTPLYRSIYNKDGVLIQKEKNAKKQLENYFNSQITELKVALIAPSTKADF